MKSMLRRPNRPPPPMVIGKSLSMSPLTVLREMRALSVPATRSVTSPETDLNA